MVAIGVHVFGDGCWPDLAGKEIIKIEGFEIAGLKEGTVRGAPSVSIRIDLPDGKVVFAEATMRQFLLAARMFQHSYAEYNI